MVRAFSQPLGVASGTRRSGCCKQIKAKNRPDSPGITAQLGLDIHVSGLRQMEIAALSQWLLQPGDVAAELM